jgi:hypothetical protein
MLGMSILFIGDPLPLCFCIHNGNSVGWREKFSRPSLAFFQTILLCIRSMETNSDQDASVHVFHLQILRADYLVFVNELRRELVKKIMTGIYDLLLNLGYLDTCLVPVRTTFGMSTHGSCAFANCFSSSRKVCESVYFFSIRKDGEMLQS